MIVIKGLKITDDEIQYIFPRDIQKISLPNYPYFQTKRHMKKTENKGHYRRPRFRSPDWKPVQREQVQFIEIFCRYCPSTLLFQFDETEKCFRLKQFSVEHVHGRDKDHHQIYKQLSKPNIYDWPKKGYSDVQEKITDLVNKLEEPMQPNQPKQPQKIPQTFTELIEFLQQGKNFIFYEPLNFAQQFQQFPDIFMFISPEMKQTYLRYHYCVGFDYTFSLVRQQPNKQSDREYLVGTISGLNQFRRLSIYALVISTKQSLEATMAVFTKFFEYMGKQPHSIVTDQSPGIVWGLRKLQQTGVFKGEALWDTFHTLKNYKMANPPLKAKMRIMIRQKCKYSFQKMYLEAITLARTEQQLDSLHRFMYQSQKYCISQINPVLVAMGVSNSQNQFVNSLIKNVIPYERKYVHVVYELSKFIEDRNNMNEVLRMPNINIEQGINRKDLKILRLSLNGRYLSFFFTQYFRLINVNMIYFQRDKSVYYVQDRMNMHRVIKNPQYDENDPLQRCQSLRQQTKMYQQQKQTNYQYLCSCQFREKTGIPCQHILKVTIRNKQNLLSQIHPRYVISDPSNLIKCIKSVAKPDYNVPINKRGTWASGRMLETYYIDKNSLKQQNQKNSRLIHPLSKGYLPALEQRNKVRNIRTQNTKNKVSNQSKWLKNLNRQQYQRNQQNSDNLNQMQNISMYQQKRMQKLKNKKHKKQGAKMIGESESQFGQSYLQQPDSDDLESRSAIDSEKYSKFSSEYDSSMNPGQSYMGDEDSMLDSSNQSQLHLNQYRQNKQKQKVKSNVRVKKQAPNLIPQTLIKLEQLPEDDDNWDDQVLDQCNYVYNYGEQDDDAYSQQQQQNEQQLNQIRCQKQADLSDIRKQQGYVEYELYNGIDSSDEQMARQTQINTKVNLNAPLNKKINNNKNSNVKKQRKRNGNKNVNKSVSMHVYHGQQHDGQQHDMQYYNKQGQDILNYSTKSGKNSRGGKAQQQKNKGVKAQQHKSRNRNNEYGKYDEAAQIINYGGRYQDALDGYMREHDHKLGNKYVDHNQDIFRQPHGSSYRSQQLNTNTYQYANSLIINTPPSHIMQQQQQQQQLQQQQHYQEYTMQATNSKKLNHK